VHTLSLLTLGQIRFIQQNGQKHCRKAYFVLQLTYEFKKEDGQIVKEDVSVDVKDNFVQYHLNDDDTEVWVHDDFNRVSELNA